MVTISEQKGDDEQNGLTFSETDKNVLGFLAAKPRVDVRWLGKQDKLRIRQVLDELHNRKRLSLLQISKTVGKSYTKIWGLCRALEIRTRSVAEADRNSAELRSKHTRTSFNGTDEEKAYMTGFSNGDLTAQQVSGTAIFVSTTTTHPAFANLFHQLFGKYGHVYQYPMHDESRGYKWKLAVRLDNSFKFLLSPPRKALASFACEKRNFLHWLAGLVDSDGNINITNGNGYARIMLVIYNNDLPLLQSIRRELLRFQYHPVGPYSTNAKGEVTPNYKIRYSSDMWQLEMERTREAQRLLRELPIQLREKQERKELALSIRRGTKWKEVKARAMEIRQKIHAEVQNFRESAEKRYLARIVRKGNFATQ